MVIFYTQKCLKKTSLIWYFDSDAVAKMKLFYEQVKDSELVEDVSDAIQKVRDKHGVKEYESIPI